MEQNPPVNSQTEIPSVSSSLCINICPDSSSSIRDTDPLTNESYEDVCTCKFEDCLDYLYIYEEDPTPINEVFYPNPYCGNYKVSIPTTGDSEIDDFLETYGYLVRI